MIGLRTSRGTVVADLDQLLVQWIGGELPITVIDVSHVPASAVEIVVGSLLGIVYDALYWGMNRLTDLLPALRTGEALVLGDALQVPSRIRVHKAPDRPVGDDPKLPQAWLVDHPSPDAYIAVVAGWRAQSTAVEAPPINRGPLTAAESANDARTSTSPEEEEDA